MVPSNEEIAIPNDIDRKPRRPLGNNLGAKPHVPTYLGFFCEKSKVLPSKAEGISGFRSVREVLSSC